MPKKNAKGGKPADGGPNFVRSSSKRSAGGKAVAKTHTVTGFEEKPDRFKEIDDTRGDETGMTNREGFYDELDIEPFPDPFPDFTGRLWRTFDDDGFGHGQAIIELKFYDLEWHPNHTDYPNMAKMMLKATNLQCPSDSKMSVGEEFVEEWFFLIDRKRKLMQNIGTNKVSKQELSPIDYGPSEKAPAADKWTFHVPAPIADIQLELNASNSVVRGVNFKDPAVQLTGDITKNIAFYFTEPIPTEIPGVCPGLRPPLKSPIGARLDKLGSYFEAEDSAFRSPANPAKHSVWYRPIFEEVLQIDTLGSAFGATMILELSWEITKLDIVDYVASDASPKWQPAWCPVALEVDNPANVKEGVQTTSSAIVPKLKKIGLANERAPRFLATKTIEIVGDFYEVFELENYPFDVQQLGCHIKSAGYVKNDMNLVSLAEPVMPESIRDTEWFSAGSASRHKYSEKDRSYELNITAVVQRHYKVHLFRVGAVLMSISGCSLTALCRGADVDCIGRLQLTVALMLTAIAYSLVLVTSIPRLGYLTLLDEYNLAQFMFMVAITLEIALLDWNDEDVDSLEFHSKWAIIGSLGAWLLLQLYFGIRIFKFVVPHEAKKKDVLDHGQTGGRVAK